MNFFCDFSQKVVKHIWGPCCHLAAENGSWFILIEQLTNSNISKLILNNLNWLNTSYYNCTGISKVNTLQKWRHDTHHNDTQHNDIRHNDIHHNDIQQNVTHHKGLIYDTQHARHSAQMTLSITTLPLCYHNAEFNYAECHYAKCRGTTKAFSF